MVRNINSIYVKEVGVSSSDWQQLPLVPATATLKKEITQEKEGVLETFELKAILAYRHSSIGRNIIMKVCWDNGYVSNMGSEDLPVRLDYSRDTSITISCKYKQRLGL